jgi:hypothetical protein
MLLYQVNVRGVGLGPDSWPDVPKWQWKLLTTRDINIVYFKFEIELEILLFASKCMSPSGSQLRSIYKVTHCMQNIKTM